MYGLHGGGIMRRRRARGRNFGGGGAAPSTLVFHAPLLTSVAPALGSGESFARNSVAYEDDYSGGAVAYTSRAIDVARFCTRNDASSNLLTGYLAEEARTNLHDRSHDVTAWSSKVNLTTPSVSTSTPFGSLSTVVLHEDNTAAAQHYARDLFTVAAGQVQFSVIAKALNRSWLRLRSQYLPSSVNTYFNLSTGAVGVSNASSAYTVGLGGGWYRCVQIATESTGGGRWHHVSICEADNDVTFDGLDQDSLAVVGSQVVDASTYALSPILTSGTSAVRVKDDLRWVGASNLGGGSPSGLTVYCELLLDPKNTAGGHVWQISDGGSPADSIYMTVEATTGVPRIRSAKTAGSAGDVTGTTNVADGNRHQLKATIEDGSLRLFVDEVEEGTADTTVNIPANLDEIDALKDASDANHLSAAIMSNLRIFSAAEPGETITPAWS